MEQTSTHLEIAKKGEDIMNHITSQARFIEINASDRDQGGNLLAPNGERSHLNEIEWKMVRTEAFKEWFGRSLVVDENGEPLITYHGSSDKFSQFDLAEVGKNRDSGFMGTGFYFTPHEELAKKYGEKMYKTFLRIEHLQVFEEDHGNARFLDKPLPPNIHDEVFRKYEPLKEREYRRLKRIDDEHKGDWSYMSNWNGEDKFEYILSDLIREVIIEKGSTGVFGYNPVSQVYEYVAFNTEDILVIPELTSMSSL